MRDMEKDLELCNALPTFASAEGFGFEFAIDSKNAFARIKVEINERSTCMPEVQRIAAFIAEAREGWAETIERAMEAEHKFEIAERWLQDCATDIEKLNERAMKAEARVQELEEQVINYIARISSMSRRIDILKNDHYTPSCMD